MQWILGAYLCFTLQQWVISDPLFVTPFIFNKQIHLAQEKSRVYLPTAPMIESYAGLITVDEVNSSNMFFWYFISEDPSTKCTILWLSGGPGTSSMLGLFFELGPFSVDEELKLHLRQYSWHKLCNLLFIDNPVGVGYSFTENENGYARSTTDCAVNLHTALIQLYFLFPQIDSTDLYLTGESYGGKYVPALSHQILKLNIIRNYKGLAIGNGLVSPRHQLPIGEYLYQQGFIDLKMLTEYIKVQFRCLEGLDVLDIGVDVEFLKECTALINPFYQTTLFGKSTCYNYTYNLLEPVFPGKKNWEDFCKLPDVRESLHVGNLTRYNNNYLIQSYLGNTLFLSEMDNLAEAINSGKNVLIYSGQLDAMVPYVGTERYLYHMNFMYEDVYRNAERWPLYVNDTVSGYCKTAGTMVECMITRAGHQVPHDQPQVAYELIKSFISGDLFNQQPQCRYYSSCCTL